MGKNKERAESYAVEIEKLNPWVVNLENENKRLRSLIYTLKKVILNQEETVEELSERVLVVEESYDILRCKTGDKLNDANFLRLEVNRWSDLSTEISDSITAFIENNEDSEFFGNICTDERIQYGLVVNPSDIASILDVILDRAQRLDNLVDGIYDNIDLLAHEIEYLPEEEC